MPNGAAPTLVPTASRGQLLVLARFNLHVGVRSGDEEVEGCARLRDGPAVLGAAALRAMTSSSSPVRFVLDLKRDASISRVVVPGIGAPSELPPVASRRQGFVSPSLGLNS